MRNTSLLITLGVAISIATKGGELQEFDILEIAEPTPLYFNLYADVREAVSKSIFKLQKDLMDVNEDTTTNADEEVTEKFELDIFAGGGELENLSNAIKAYLLQYGEIGGVRVTQPILNKISFKDWKNIIERVSYFLYQM